MRRCHPCRARCYPGNWSRRTGQSCLEEPSLTRADRLSRLGNNAAQEIHRALIVEHADQFAALVVFHDAPLRIRRARGDVCDLECGFIRNAIMPALLDDLDGVFGCNFVSLASWV
jgi:hypothetical protein